MFCPYSSAGVSSCSFQNGTSDEVVTLWHQYFCRYQLIKSRWSPPFLQYRLLHWIVEQRWNRSAAAIERTMLLYLFFSFLFVFVFAIAIAIAIVFISFTNSPYKIWRPRTRVLFIDNVTWHPKIQIVLFRFDSFRFISANPAFIIHVFLPRSI